MNLLGDGIALNQRKSIQIENDLRLSQENPNLLINQGKNNLFIPGISEEKLIFLTIIHPSKAVILCLIIIRPTNIY